jgi:putative ABC transport system substrate-binding protein
MFKGFYLWHTHCRGKGTAMNKKLFWLITLLLLAATTLAEAQQPKKVPRIGFLVPGSQSAYSTHIEAFRQGLGELGYTEGKDVAVEYLYAENNLDLLAAELVRLKVDVIFTGGQPMVRAVMRATKTIPIVMVNGDAVGNGIVDSLARPGGNVTGLSFLSPEVRGKQMELLKETFPKITRIAVLLDPAFASTELVNEAEIGRQVGLQTLILEVRGPKELESAFKTAIEKRVGAVLIRAHPLFSVNRKSVVDLAAKTRLPAMYPWKEFVQAGGLMTYGPNLQDLYRRAATYVDKILKGSKPADLPVEQPTKFELVINLKTAKALGVTIPPVVMMRAEKVIK